MRGICEQQWPSRDIWNEFEDDPHLRGGIRILVNRVFAYAAKSTHAKWLASAMEGKEIARRSTLRLAMEVVGI